MARPWLDEELPLEHRRAHAHEWLSAMNELLSGDAWPRLEELLGSWIEERRDHLERGAGADTDEFHRGFIACARLLLSEPVEAAAAASSYIDNHHQEHIE